MKYEVVEVEALGQGVITEIVRAALDALLPEPLRRLEAAGELRQAFLARRLGGEEQEADLARAP